MAVWIISWFLVATRAKLSAKWALQSSRTASWGDTSNWIKYLKREPQTSQATGVQQHTKSGKDLVQDNVLNEQILAWEDIYEPIWLYALLPSTPLHPPGHCLCSAWWLVWSFPCAYMGFLLALQFPPTVQNIQLGSSGYFISYHVYMSVSHCSSHGDLAREPKLSSDWLQTPHKGSIGWMTDVHCWPFV